jgi:signal transduction histidine kinase
MHCSKLIHRVGWLFYFLMLCYGCRQDEKQLLANKDRIWHALEPMHLQAEDSLRFGPALDSVYSSLSEQGPYQQWERYKLYASYAYYTTGDFDKALRYTDSMLSIFGKGSDLPAVQEMYLESLFFQGDVLVKARRFDEAFSVYYEAREFHLSRQDTCASSRYTSRVAMVSYERKRYAEAIGYYKQLLLELPHCNAGSKFDVFAGIQGNLDNIGICYYFLRQLDSAEHYYRLALAYIEQHKMEVTDAESFVLNAQAVIYGNLATTLVKQKNYDEAEELYIKCIYINIDPQRSPADAAQSMNSLADMYMQTGKIDKVPPLFKRIDSLRNAYPAWGMDPHYLPTRAKYAMLKGQPELAYNLLEKATKMRDSISARTQERRTPDMQEAYKRLGAQYKLQIANRRKSEFLQIAIIFGIMLLAILLLLWRSYRRTQKNFAVLNGLNEDMRQKNEHLLSTLEELEQLSRAKQKMTHVVVHDLRGPIGSISSVAQLYIEDESIQDPKELREVLGMIAMSAQSSLTLINELMRTRDMEKVNTNGNETVEMQALLRYCINVLKHRADEKAQTVELTGSEARIEGNKEKLLRIFHNLLDNAIKFSRHNTTIAIHVALLRSHVQVTVTDDGIGMPDEMQQIIDKERSLASRKGTDGEPSFGLGLSIVYQLMEEHEGNIWFKSVDGKGTTFYLEFPLY